jgi:hypothetical protein
MSEDGLLLAALSAGEAVIAAVVVLAITTVALLVMLRAVRSSSRDAEQRMARLVSELDRRTHEIRQELGDALAREQEHNRLARTFGELTASIDLDEVLRRTVDTAVALPGIDAAHVAVVTLGASRPSSPWASRTPRPMTSSSCLLSAAAGYAR